MLPGSNLTTALSCGVESEGVPEGRAAEAGPRDWLPTVLTASLSGSCGYTQEDVQSLSCQSHPSQGSAQLITGLPSSSVQVHREPQWQEGLWAKPSWGFFLAEQKERCSELGSAHNHGRGHFPRSLQIALFYNCLICLK